VTSVDCVVVGGGPAGLAAARTAGNTEEQPAGRARDLDTPIHWPGARQLTDWTRLSPAEIPLVAEINPMMQVAEVERRLAEGQDCLLGWVGQDLAYYHWATAQPTYLAYLDKTLRPRENQVFGDGSYVAPRFRHRGIYQEATTRNLIYERERGRHSYLFLVAWWHRPSIRVNLRLGCVPVGSIGRCPGRC